MKTPGFMIFSSCTFVPFVEKRFSTMCDHNKNIYLPVLATGKRSLTKLGCPYAASGVSG